MSQYDGYKQQVLEYSQMLARKGYLIGSGGNVSIRVEGEDALAVTPSGREYLSLSLDDICVFSFEQQSIEGTLRPSIETGMHIAVYRARLDVNAVVHTHQPYASTFAVINRSIPALFDEQVIELGDRVVIVPYGLSGSEDLHENIAAHLDNQCNAYIMQNHGALCLGVDIAQAARNAEILEKCARVYYYALATGEEVTTIDEEIQAILFEILKSKQRKEAQRQESRLQQN